MQRAYNEYKDHEKGLNMNLLQLIKEKCPYIDAIRCTENGIELSIQGVRESNRWIRFHQAPLSVDKVIKKWISLGGTIEDEE